MDFQPGDKARVNGLGDLYMEAEARPFINQEVVIVKKTKGGMYLVQITPRLQYTVAKRNLDPL